MNVRQVLIVALTAGAGASLTGATQGVPLAVLTVPAKALTSECRLQPDSATNVRSAFATNPWIGDDRRAMSMIKTAMGFITKVPDGPPLDRRQAAEFERRSMEGVHEGYRAAYEDSDGVDVEVLALDFDTAAQAAAMQLTANRTTRFVRGSTLIVITRRDAHSGCFEAVQAHIAALK
jgi:hypothetical protein